MRKFNSKTTIMLILMLVVSSVYTVQIYNILSFPSQIDILKGENETIDILFPFTVRLDNRSESSVIKYEEDRSQSLKANVRNTFSFKSLENGNAKLQFEILGLIPIKNVSINVVDKLYLIPGGNTIGVRLETKGVLVVALSDDLIGIDGKKYSPSIDAGIKIGDVITEINGVKVKNAAHVIEMLNQLGDDKITISLQRNSHTFTTEVQPVKCNQDNSYRLGLWVRDKTAGIGTLTFYHPKSKKFGALGHGITDVDTGALMPISNGDILKATISSIELGKKGEPGELRGAFFESNKAVGNISNNSQFGIYGTLQRDIDGLKLKEPLPIGLQNEVELGKAYILSTIDNNKVEKYEIEILKIQPQGYPSQKSMIIRVTDEELLEKTGGIVQGMSGSPIIQNGKIIGAVTHVFVNDPTKGYGIYINWMLKEAGISLTNNLSLEKAN